MSGAWLEAQSLRPFTTLRAGGPAEWLTIARSADDLIAAARTSLRRRLSLTTLGWGSNVLPSDKGLKGLALINQATKIEVDPDGTIVAESGSGFQEVFLRSAQAGLTGLEFAVGIPGTLGGALVSNAGAYRSGISAILQRLEVVLDGEVAWVDPSFMQFSYRDSILRRPNPPHCVVTRIELKLRPGNPREIYDAARDFQRQRISKQPAPASAGSFFKNVNDRDLAGALPNLPPALKEAGVVPAGYLIENVGMKGHRHGGAMLGRRHANFMLNVGNASAREIRELAEIARQRVFARFGVKLEEEVLYLGDWS